MKARVRRRDGGDDRLTPRRLKRASNEQGWLGLATYFSDRGPICCQQDVPSSIFVASAHRLQADGYDACVRVYVRARAFRE